MADLFGPVMVSVLAVGTAFPAVAQEDHSCAAVRAEMNRLLNELQYVAVLQLEVERGQVCSAEELGTLAAEARAQLGLLPQDHHEAFGVTERSAARYRLAAAHRFQRAQTWDLSDAERANVQAWMGKLRPTLAAVRLPAAPKHVTVRAQADGTPLVFGPDGLAFLLPGQHLVTVTLVGADRKAQQAWSKTVNLGVGGEPLTLEVAPGPVRALRASPRRAAPAPAIVVRDGAPPLGPVLLAGGGALLLAGSGVTWALSTQEARKLSPCSRGECAVGIEATRARANFLGGVTTALLISGVAAVTSGVTWWLIVGLSGAGEPQETTHVAVHLAEGQAGLVVNGSF
ncbi:MAG: hypothetical protein OXU20_04330 [Myxococcales bacterium]|nr:hypothetical protein [Myxococcales bacterium]